MDEKIEILKRLKISLSGHLYLGDQMKEGWKKSLPFYLFKCPIHGLVKSYPKGHSKRLDCPLCQEELLKNYAEKKNRF